MGRPDPGPLQSLKNLFDEFSRSYEGQEHWADRAEWEGRPLTERGEGEPTAVHASDVVQGGHTDCVLMAGMAAVVQAHPNPNRWLDEVIKDHGDGSYTVTFYELKRAAMPYDPVTGGPTPAEYTTRSVTVRDELFDAARSDDGTEKWPAVIEKAYAEAYGGEGSKPFDQRDKLGDPMERLTGLPSTRVDPRNLSIDQLDAYLKDHHAVTVKTFDSPPVPDEIPRTHHPAYAPGGLAGHNPVVAMPHPDDQRPRQNAELKPWHEYYVHKVDKESGMVVLHNVWNPGGRADIKIPFDQFQTGFEHANVNPVYKR